MGHPTPATRWSGRRGPLERPRPPRIRTCVIDASGSSWHGFAARRDTKARRLKRVPLHQQSHSRPAQVSALRAAVKPPVSPTPCFLTHTHQRPPTSRGPTIPLGPTPLLPAPPPLHPP